MNRELLVRSVECELCAAIGKDLKSIIPTSQIKQNEECKVPNQEIQIDIASPIIFEIYIFCIDRFSNCASAVFYNGNASNALKILDIYINSWYFNIC